MVYVLLSLVLSFLVCISHWFYSWRNPKCNGKLPPGSMGLPIIGETFQFFTPYTTQFHPFISKRVERFGSVFRTSLVGHTVVVCTDPDLCRYVFQQEGKLVRSWYMDSFEEIVGKSVHGYWHKYLRNLILNSFGIESLKRILPEIEELTSKQLLLWSKQGSVDLKEAISAMVFNFTSKKLFSYDESGSSQKLKHSYFAFMDGLISFPLNIPGFAYRKCLQGRNEAVKIIKDMMDKRRATPNMQKKDFLDVLIEEMKKDGSIITEKTAVDILFALPFAAFETASSVLVLGIQYLGQHPSALEELTREHEDILRNRKNIEHGITWEEYKSMTFTHMVINETARLANTVPGIFRKVVKNIELKEYTIPPDWIIMVCPAAVHLSPEKYKNPLKFNPWRWQGQELHSGSENFMAFGGGIRLCVGAEFAKLLMATFLHHLVIKYRWNVIKGDVVRRPGLIFPNGFHVQISEKNVHQVSAD